MKTNLKQEHRNQLQKKSYREESKYKSGIARSSEYWILENKRKENARKKIEVAKYGYSWKIAAENCILKMNINALKSLKLLYWLW